ncbi:helix-turn-helix domain-containing protein [Amycolatopsis sp. CA-230715]|uniref:helix-turn-helix domain-containing protein n=1 Tax=Amycolatopsis sp. CA-230715 TaxID=2745196 RepID=UPI001C339ED5|nr:helix-turn-helix transcriptional regulator [Amycolatopsis sp. CA-230715]QWF77324.1 hypothetical protein HUW46_00716 [Amycolatopsis sp. CA-230715]
MVGKAERESSARAREIGEELRDARVTAKISAADLAKAMDCSQTKISRLETGGRGASELDVTMYLTACGVGRKDILRILDLVRETDDGYRLRPHREQMPDQLRSLSAQEALASSILVFEPMLVPGILQTEDYARHVFRAAGVLAPWDIEASVSARMTRQRLLRSPTSPYFTFYLHEHALRNMVGNLPVMHEQIMQLLLASSYARCEIRVIRSATSPGGVFGEPFWFMRYAEHRPMVYVESHTTSLFLEDKEDLDKYRRTVSKLGELALDGAQSRRWLATLASEYDRVKDSRDEHPRPDLA